MARELCQHGVEGGCLWEHGEDVIGSAARPAADTWRRTHGGVYPLPHVVHSDALPGVHRGMGVEGGSLQDGGEETAGILLAVLSSIDTYGGYGL
mgnify:CR=1 FL=1